MWLNDSSGFVTLESDPKTNESTQWFYDVQSGDRRAWKADGELPDSEARSLSPRGTHRLVIQGAKLAVVDLENRTETLLASGPADRAIKYRNPVWSPDGSRVAFIEADGTDVRQRSVLVPGDPSYAVADSTVAKYLVRTRKPSSPTWKTLLQNHLHELAAVDFFTVQTVTFRVLYVFVVLSLDRRRVLHFHVTTCPSAEWTAQQVVEAFLFATALQFLMRDRDGIYGEYFQRRVKSQGCEEVVSAPRSPWQNPFVERLIGSIRRECLNHAIMFNERHLLRILRSYFEYYHESRTHMGLNDDAPLPRQVERPERGAVIAIPQVGGLHHRYTRRAA